MTNKLKFLFSLLIAVSLIFACSSNKSDKDKDKSNTQNKQQPDPKDQYRMAELYSDDQSQLIDLIEGKATFVIVYEGDGNFKATLLTTDGKQVEVLADVNGNYKGKKTITVPVTSAYILDVHCKGKWSVYRE